MNSVKKITLLVLGLLFGLAIAELLLSVLKQPKFYKNHTYPAQFAFVRLNNNDITYFNVPSRRIRFIYDGNPRGYFGKDNEVDHLTNSLGFRGGEFTLEKTKNYFRIAFLGDSVTFGEGVHFTDSYPEQVSSILNQKYADSGVKFQSYNFGVGGYNTSQELFLLKNIALGTYPDAVVLKYDVSEAEPPLYKGDQTSAQLVRIPRWYEQSGEFLNTQPPNSFIYKFRLSQLVWQVIKNQKQNKVMVVYYKSLFEEKSQGWQESRSALLEIIKLCGDNNISCYVIFFPTLYRLNDGYPFKHIHELVRKELQGKNAVFIDLFPALKNRDAAALWVHPRDHHPNEIVHKIAAQAIAEKIYSDKNLSKKIDAIKKNN